jgi:predicted nucleic-acid-binding protein
MVALDTNLLLRFVLDDDPVQSIRARSFLAEQSVYVPLTVILEFAWALRRIYKFSKRDVNTAILAFSQIETVKVEQIDRVELAMCLAEAGADFADALHLASSQSCEWLATFDQKFVKAAAKSNPPVRHP